MISTKSNAADQLRALPLERRLEEIARETLGSKVEGSYRAAQRDAVREAIAELARLRAWTDDLMSGLYVNCVYCGHRYGPRETTPVTMADALKAHVAQCPQHPMSGLLKACKAASHALRSYQHGNASSELAQEIADACDAAIAKVQP